ncbi:hypothetical protein CsSME_00052245 [Camellia sinensis var. sinensis]
MVCIGLALFGCRHPSATSYIISALIIIGIVIGLRVLCYTIHRLLDKRHEQPEPSSDNGGGRVEMEMEMEMEMQPWNREWARAHQCRVTVPESKVVILAGENHASFIAQPVPFQAN